MKERHCAASFDAGCWNNPLLSKRATGKIVLTDFRSDIYYCTIGSQKEKTGAHDVVRKSAQL
jgi:hypothetical protein